MRRFLRPALLLCLAVALLARADDPPQHPDGTNTVVIGDRETGEVYTVLRQGSAPARKVARAATDDPPAKPVGDGKADDTAALQGLIDAAPAGSLVRIPAGRYRTTRPLVIGKTLSIVGDGAYAQALGPFGNADYGTGAVEWGTVIAYEGKDGAAIDHMPGKYTGLRVEALVLAGRGDASRTSTGLRASYRAGAVTLAMRDVHLSNFAVGLDLDSVENGRLDNLRINGCDVGIVCRLNTNANLFSAIVLASCGDGVILQGAAKNTFLAPCVEGAIRNGFILRATAEENSIRDGYFEGSATCKFAIDVQAGCDATTIDSNHLGTPGDNLRIAAAGCRIFAAKYTAGLTVSGPYGQVMGTWFGASPALSTTTTHVGDQYFGITAGGPVRWPGSGSLDSPPPGTLRFRSSSGKATTLARP